MQTELIRYRAEPTNRNFKSLYDVSRDWIRIVAGATVKSYHGLKSADFDDVANEGLLSFANAARRFVYFCPRCGDAFLHRRSLVRHCREAHRVRGVAELVSISKFAQVNSRLAMKRTARRLLRPEVLVDDLEVVSGSVVSGSVESETFVEVLLGRAKALLSDSAERLLVEIVRSGHRPELGPDLDEIRSVLAPELIHPGLGDGGGKR